MQKNNKVSLEKKLLECIMFQIYMRYERKYDINLINGLLNQYPP